MKCTKRTIGFSKRSIIACLSGFLLFPAAARAQTADRILTFDSAIVVHKNRILDVRERIEVANDAGFFDRGLHRHLGIKPAGRLRPKAGSFERIQAKIDGQVAQIQTTQTDNRLDIGISEGHKLGRGDHLVELEYTATGQFAVYSDFEDLNLDVTGEWPVPISRATVELDFPDGMPPGTSISADTGTDSDFRFDCIRTYLPSGLRYETTHAIPPNQRLFISARWDRGYFVSDRRQGGMRTERESRRWLFLLLITLLALAVFTAIAYALAPKDNPGYTAAPRWIRLLIASALPGTAVFALRLVYEQTVLTWRYGEQMVGFSLMHAFVILFVLMLLSFYAANVGLFSALSVTVGRWLRHLPTPRWNWLPLAALCLCVGLVYVPYDVWMITTVRLAGPGKHGTSFLMLAAADGKLSLARALVQEGVSLNTMAGGSTALDVACSSRRIELARFLLAQGADMSKAPSCVSLPQLKPTHR
jgi:hypothetical protein